MTMGLAVSGADMVEKFFDKIDVAAILLSSDLKVGDNIEMEGEDGKFTMTVSSMQIERKDVTKAKEGDSVGIKVPQSVIAGSEVYRS